MIERPNARRPGPCGSLLLLLACVLALAGCGGGGPSEDDYEAGLAEVKEHLDEATEASRASGETTDVEERREHLGEAHEAIDAAARRAAELEPPDDARAAHEEFADALEDYADLFDRLARLGENDPGETELYTEAGEIARRLDDASRALEKAGYSVDEDEG